MPEIRLIQSSMLDSLVVFVRPWISLMVFSVFSRQFIIFRCTILAIIAMVPKGKPRCDICKGIFASRENVYNHKRTQHDDIVEYHVCPFWPICRNNKHLNGLYQSLSNLRVHLYKHHDRVKGAECIDLSIEKVYWKRKRRSNFFPFGFFWGFFVVSNIFNISQHTISTISMMMGNFLMMITFPSPRLPRPPVISNPSNLFT